MSNRLKQRLLGSLLVVTTIIMIADLAGHPATDAARSASGAAIGPVQRFLAGAGPDEVAALAAENARLRVEADSLARQVEVLGDVRDLLGSGHTTDHTVVIGQVVATELSPLGGRSVTVDVGSRDGVAVDSTVVSHGGLVGRVMAVSLWTSDVQVLGADQSVVAVRVGERGLLGTVGPVPAGSGSDGAGQLSLSLAQPGVPSVGDHVSTLGSVGGRPYAPGITVGRVVSVDPDRGRVTVTGRVAPAVDRNSLDVVAVLVPEARGEPRPPADGPGGNPAEAAG